MGTVTATDIQSVTHIIWKDLLQITAAGVLIIQIPAGYESQTSDPVTLPYDGTYDVTATASANDASGNAVTQLVTVRIRDFGGIDDDDNTGTGTDTATEQVLEQVQVQVLEQAMVQAQAQAQVQVHQVNEPWQLDIAKISQPRLIFQRKKV